MFFSNPREISIYNSREHTEICHHKRGNADLNSWFEYLIRGLSRKKSEDPLRTNSPLRGLKSNMQNLKPFISRHWRKGLLGAILILFVTLLAFPQPLIYRFLIDKVILAKNLDLLIWVILLMIAVKVLEKGMGVLQ